MPADAGNRTITFADAPGASAPITGSGTLGPAAPSSALDSATLKAVVEPVFVTWTLATMSFVTGSRTSDCKAVASVTDGCAAATMFLTTTLSTDTPHGWPGRTSAQVANWSCVNSKRSW